MTLVIWWLAVLGGVVLLVALAVGLDARRSVKPSTVLLEPFGLLVKRWPLARLSGQTSQVAAALAAWQRAGVAERTVLDDLLPPPKGRPAVKIEAISRRPLPLIGEQRLLWRGRQRFSVVIGLRAETEPLFELSAHQRADVRKLEQDAGAHGFLALLVGQTAVHSATADAELGPLSYQYVGAILVEAQIDPAVVTRLTPLRPTLRLLTILPPALAEHLADQLGLIGSTMSLAAERSIATLEASAADAAVFADADTEARHRVIRALELTHHCQLLSRYPADARLPLSLSRFD